MRALGGWVMSLGLVTGCARRAAPRAAPEPAVTPSDAPFSQRLSAKDKLRAGWERYEQRRTIKPGETVEVGPVPYSRVKLVEVADDNRSAVFEASHLIDQRRGRVWVGQHFNSFTPIFGNKGAHLEAVDANGATVAFRWSQSPTTPIPPGAVKISAVDASTRPAASP